MNDQVDRLIDKTNLQRYLEDVVGPADRFEVEYAEEGTANETLFIDWSERELVLRRPPAESTAEGAHQVLRDYEIFEALAETDIPVPEPVVRCHDSSVIGSEFYISERVRGVVPHPDEPRYFADLETRCDVSEALIDTLADIHQLDYESIGLGELGHPEGFTERQIRRWGDQIEWATSTTADEREIPELDYIQKWLTQNLPDDLPAPSLVHGDYGLHNLMFSEESPSEIVAVFDWEMGTIGNPFVDLGWLLMFWPDADDPEILAPELIPTFVKKNGYLDRTELIDRYESQVGNSFRSPRFYRVLGVYKLAAVGEMFFARHLQGDAVDPLFEKMDSIVPSYVERAERIIEAEDPLRA